MPCASYLGRVLRVNLSEMGYGKDLSNRLDKKNITYYVECRGLGQPIQFYMIGTTCELRSIIRYGERCYNTKYLKVMKTKSFKWKEFLGTLDDKWCAKGLTSCSLNDFYDEVKMANGAETTVIPEPVKCQRYHCRKLVVDEDTTVGGRFHPIVPYAVDSDSDGENDYHSV